MAPRIGGLRAAEKPAEEILTGRQAIRVANTAISISTDPPGTTVIVIGCREVLVQADRGNAGNIAVGDENCTETPGRGGILAAGESITISIDQVNKVFINGPTLTEGVSWIAIR